MMNQKKKVRTYHARKTDINVTAQGHDYTRVSEFIGCFFKLLCKPIHERSLEFPQFNAPPLAVSH